MSTDLLSLPEPGLQCSQRLARQVHGPVLGLPSPDTQSLSKDQVTDQSREERATHLERQVEQKQYSQPAALRLSRDQHPPRPARSLCV